MPQTIHHTTHYSFETPVKYALQKVRLRPLTGPLQTVTSWVIKVTGGKIETGYTDHYGNHVDLISAQDGASELTIEAQGEVETHDKSGILGPVYTRAPLWHFSQSTALTDPSDAIKALAKTISTRDSLLDGLHTLSAAILEAVAYEAGTTQSETTAAEAVALGTGVCQDHSHIFISAARHAGLPARYVSGYLHMSDSTQQDAMHGWAEAHIGDLGWVGFDVSNGISPDSNYVRIAIGRDAQDAAPITGLRIGAGDATLKVSLQVQQ